MGVGWFLESFVSATLQVGLQQLADFGKYAYASISDVEVKLQTLQRSITSVQREFLPNNDEQHKKAWEDLAYDAADLIDEILITVSKLEAAGHGNLNPVNRLLSSFSKLTSAPNLTSMQAQISDVLDTIGRHKEHGQQQSQSPYPQTTSLVDESRIFGRGTDKKDIIKMMVSQEEPYTVSIIPIVGMIGVGKTTLAQLVYNHDYQEVMTHPFDLKIWVCVTKHFDIMKVTKSMIDDATKCGGESHCLDLQSLHLKLQAIIQDKKFLLVLDDLWHEDRDELDLLLRPLKRGLKGSKIIVTTRSDDVVSSLEGATKAHHLECLSDQDCWLILKHQAFGNTQMRIDPKLEAIGKKIARRCKGFPLAANSLGGLLGTKISKVAWNNILRKEVWSVKNVAVRALRSNFCDHLPSHLRDFFAYSSIFPQKYDFEKDKMVRMWIGEGFIRPSEEELGRKYFDQLFKMTIFSLEAQKYKMNEAVHDLAQAVCGDKFFRIEETQDSCINANTRYLSLVRNEVYRMTVEAIHRQTFEASYNCKGLRTFLLFNKHGTKFKEVPITLFSELERLRVLDLSGSRIEELAKNIGNLKHLRFLDLSNTLLKFLPEDIQELSLLQTLRLVSCSELLDLPKGTSKLKRLQHLELGNSRLKSMPLGIGKLTTLQTLTDFIVGKNSGQMKELKDMNDIRGSLCIKQLENVSNPAEAAEANLAKKYIEELELQWNSAGDAYNEQHVLGKLMIGPHNSLQRLILRNYAGIMLPGWVSDQSSKLTSIVLKDCKNCEVLPALGQLPHLRSLEVDGMHKLEKIDNDFCGKVAGFHALESLKFQRMLQLERWDGVQEEDMPQLCELTMVNCPKLVILPSLHYFQSLERLEFAKCPQLPSLPEEALSSSVEHLIISECPILEERCKRVGAEDWMKIKHIPRIEVGWEIVREPEA